MQNSKDPTTRPDFQDLPDEALIRLVFLVSWGLVPFSASTLWRKVRRGEFPSPVKVSSQVTAWRVGDVRKWLKNPSAFQTIDKSVGQCRE